MNIFVVSNVIEILVLYHPLKLMKKSIISVIIFLNMFVQLHTLKATDVVFNVVVPVPTYECWIVGSYNGWNILNATKCTKMDFTHYKVTLNDSTWAQGITTANVEYKYLSVSGDWGCSEKNTNGTEVPVRNYEEGKNDTIAGWAFNCRQNTEGFFWMDIYVQTPLNTNECYIIGSFNNWESPVDSCKFEKYYTNLDGTVFFLKTIFLSNKLSYIYRFCSGPGLEYEQSLPDSNFQYPNIKPIVTSWKSTYNTVVSELPVSNVRIYNNASDIIIEGTEINDIVNVYSITGLNIRTFKSVGERIVYSAQKNEIYFVTTPAKSAKILIK